MEKKMFRPKMANKEFLENFKIVLDDHLAIYRIIVNKVRKELGITDDRAVQAAAFTLWKQTVTTLGTPNLIFWDPSDEPRENLYNFNEYAVWYGDRIGAFVSLCVETYDLEEDEVRTVLRTLDIKQSVFDSIVDHGAMAAIVKLTAEVLAGQKDEDDDDVRTEMKSLQAKAFGHTFGKSVDEVIGDA